MDSNLKRAWKARAMAGKWIPAIVVYALDPSKNLHENWVQHPSEPGFMKLRKSPEVAKKAPRRFPEVPEDEKKSQIKSTI